MPNLDKIKARREKITPGKWRTEFGEAVKIRAKHGGYVATLGWLKGPYGSMGRISNNEGEANAHFIANAPTDIDWLIAEVERLKAEKAQAEAEAEKKQSHLEFLRAELATVNDILANIAEGDVMGHMSFEGRKTKIEAELQQATKGA